MHHQNTQTLCMLDIPGAKIDSGVGSRLAREEQFGKCEMNPFLRPCALLRFLSLNGNCSVES